MRRTLPASAWPATNTSAWLPLAQPGKILFVHPGQHLQLAQVDQRQQWGALADLLASLHGACSCAVAATHGRNQGGERCSAYLPLSQCQQCLPTRLGVGQFHLRDA